LGALLGFIAGMPVLAIPAVNNSLDEWLFPAAPPVDTLPSVDRPEDRPDSSDSPTIPGTPTNAARMRTVAGAVDKDRLSDGLSDGMPGGTTGGTPGGKAGGTIGGTTNRMTNRMTDAVARLPPTDIPVSSSRFEAIQRRLQELGAVYFRLEDTGGSPSRYRFRCELPLPGNATYLRPFEHEDADPDRAMQAVLDEVELWLAAKRMRPPSGGNAGR
jgi:hypothetical protein